jgi:hypothetical protein
MDLKDIKRNRPGANNRREENGRMGDILFETGGQSCGKFTVAAIPGRQA